MYLRFVAPQSFPRGPMPITTEEQRTLAFLKIAAIQLRNIADRAPDVAAEVLRIAEQIEAEAAEIERRR